MHRRLAFVVTAAVALALGTAAVVGRPGAAPRADTAGIDELTTQLERRLAGQPADVDGWRLLARSEAAQGRWGASVSAYRRAEQLAPGDAELLADHADAAAMAQGRSALGEPQRLIERALSLDPRNLKALALAATAAEERRDGAAAQAYWERARRESARREEAIGASLAAAAGAASVSAANGAASAAVPAGAQPPAASR